MSTENREKTVAVMQPYLFPYLGYFQLIKAADCFVFYDDVSYITNGWINRNRILVNSEPAYITLQVQKASSNKLINEINVGANGYKLLKTISMAYRRAPLFPDVFPLIETCFNGNEKKISDVAIKSVSLVSEYLGLSTDFSLSSERFYGSKGLERADRLIEITKDLNGARYINMEGGATLYKKEYFEAHGLCLDFLRPNLPVYEQFANEFVPGLSIIDVLMFNDIPTVQKMLNTFEIV